MLWKAVLTAVCFHAVLFFQDCSACPEQCQCLEENRVHCQESGHTTIPAKGIPKDTVDLILTSSQIKEIETDTFRGFGRLRKLILDNNKITTLAPHAFRGLSNMEEISLQNNPLALIPSYGFADLSHINNLYLGFNRIATIESNAFHGLKNVDYFVLDGNPITKIRPKAFNNVQNIAIMSMPQNIDVIERDAFNGLQNVSELQLGELNSDVIPQFAFRGLSNVSVLRIHDSSIKSIDSGAFTGVSKIQNISIEKSVIGSIKQAAFAGMSNIGELVISENKITNFQPGALEGLKGDPVRRLRIINNSVPCDCRILWILDHTRVVPNLLEQTTCTEPQEYFNQSLSRVSYANFSECDPENFEPKKGRTEKQKVNGTSAASTIDGRFVTTLINFLTLLLLVGLPKS